MWEWMSGKKTIAATILLGLSAIGSQVLIGIWAWEPWWIDKAILTLDWAGLLLGGTGLVHKAAKARNGAR